MLGKLLAFVQVLPLQQGFPQIGHFLFQSAGKHGKTHDLDQADVLFFDVVEFLVGVVQPHGMLLRRQVVPQDQIQLIPPLPHTGDGGDGIVGLAVGLRENRRRRVAVGAPLGKDLARQITEVILVLRIQAKHRHRVSHHAAVHVVKAGNLEAKLLLRLFHGECVVAALKMFVGQYAAAHNGQVRVRPKEIVGELLHKGKQLIKHSPVNDHGRVPGVHDDAVLIIINVGRILEAP